MQDTNLVRVKFDYLKIILLFIHLDYHNYSLPCLLFTSVHYTFNLVPMINKVRELVTVDFSEDSTAHLDSIFARFFQF